eukprot:Blabericola_migrator_1__9104@NODE_4862_length_953_cov_5_345372_g3039_i0_p1_GENE_NODE_4862_length_953_cov_5_345372_g3039_i0NODE_4862_length_953_cov_5_345372_g3039_i0_p1_ORF_typecomplete_len136_score14_04DUF3273/PF11677_8/4_1e07DUF2721/PF11026_8/4e02DUF2721/PF11026_8/0_4_NODE_4862_length_953_cov_5_345372_g3039_i0426833
MYFTYVVRPGEAPIGRSPNFRPFWDACMNVNLRSGLGLMLMSLLVILVASIIGGHRGGLGLVTLSTSGERMNSSYCAVTCIYASLMWTLGTCLVQGFRNCGDDESRLVDSALNIRASFFFAVSSTLEVTELEPNC